MTPDLSTVQEDFLAWCDHMGVKLYDWQREAFGEATKREGGRFKYRVAGISVPRGNGKSRGGSRVGEWFLRTRPKVHVLTAALLTDGARVVLDYSREDFRGKHSVQVMADSIVVPSTGSRWTITSREHTSSRGLHPDLVIYDEVGWVRDDELFASLLAAQASVEDPLMLVISTVGRRKSGPLWTVKTLAEGGDSDVLFWYSQENLSPRIKPEFLDRQRRILLPGQYAREHQNQWVDAADSFASTADVDAAMMGNGWTEQFERKPGVEYAHFWDLGAVHDPTVGAVGHAENGLVYIDRLITFQGSREEPVKLAAVEEMMRDLARRFPPQPRAGIRVESWQGISAVQSLERLGLPVKLFTPTAKSNAEEWPVLAQRLTTRTLVLFPHARLREELLNLVYEVGPQGVRLIDRGKIHQDHAVAVRGVVAALERPAIPPLMIVAADAFPTWSSEEAQRIEDERNRAAEETVRSAIATQGAFFPGDF